MMRRNAGIKKSLLLFCLLYFVVFPAIHEYQDRINGNFSSSVQIFENPHSHDPGLNRENEFKNFDLSNACLFLMPLQASRSFQQAPFNSFPSLLSTQQNAILRC
jgi:hypothetical protein